MCYCAGLCPVNKVIRNLYTRHTDQRANYYLLLVVQLIYYYCRGYAHTFAFVLR